MAGSETILALLREAMALSQRMLELAQNGEWEALVTNEAERSDLIAKLRAFEAHGSIVPASSPAREEALQMMSEILKADEQTGRLVTTWMGQISRDLGELDLARKVGAAYGVR